MEQSLTTLIALAQIAGIFVGFGALISFTRSGEVAVRDYHKMSGIVQTSLIVVAVNLIPIALIHLNISERDVWFYSSAMFLVLRIVLYLQSYIFGARERRVEAQAQLKTAPMVFAMLLDIPIVTFLLLVLFGAFPDRAEGMYIAATVLLLFEAALLLATLTWPSEDSPEQ